MIDSWQVKGDASDTLVLDGVKVSIWRFNKCAASFPVEELVGVHRKDGSSCTVELRWKNGEKTEIELADEVEMTRARQRLRRQTIGEEFGRLPREIMREIGERMDNSTWCALRSTCKELYDMLGGTQEAEKRTKDFLMWGGSDGEEFGPVVFWKMRGVAGADRLKRIVGLFIVEEESRDVAEEVARGWKGPVAVESLKWKTQYCGMQLASKGKFVLGEQLNKFWTHPEEARWVGLQDGTTVLGLRRLHYSLDECERLVAEWFKPEFSVVDHRGCILWVSVGPWPKIPERGSLSMYCKAGKWVLLAHKLKEGGRFALDVGELPEGLVGLEVEVCVLPVAADRSIKLTKAAPVVGRVRIERLFDVKDVRVAVSTINGEKCKKRGKNVLFGGSTLTLEHNFPTAYYWRGAEIRLYMNGKGVRIGNMSVSERPYGVESKEIMVAVPKHGECSQVTLRWCSGGGVEVEIPGVFEFKQPKQKI